MTMADGIEISGLDELAEDFRIVARKYPDRAGEELRKEAKELRKDVIAMVENDTDEHLTKDGSKTKRSLTKASSYEISPVQGFNERQFVDISAKSPHFHLLENGHQLVSHKGRVLGFVPGYHFMDRARKDHAKKLPERMEKMVNNLLESENL